VAARTCSLRGYCGAREMAGCPIICARRMRIFVVRSMSSLLVVEQTRANVCRSVQCLILVTETTTQSGSYCTRTSSTVKKYYLMSVGGTYLHKKQFRGTWRQPRPRTIAVRKIYRRQNDCNEADVRSKASRLVWKESIGSKLLIESHKSRIL